MKKPDLKFAAVFLLSAAVIAYELAVMRTFSVGSWSNFGSMVISIALLGFGLAGTVLTFLQERVKRNPDLWLANTALALPLLMSLAHILAQQVPFNPVLISSEPAQLWWIAAYYLIYSLPFVCAAFFIGVAFIAFSSRIARLYFWNMTGSGIGGFFILGCMFFFPPDRLIIPVLCITFLAAVFCYIAWQPGTGLVLLHPLRLAAGAGGLLLAVLLLLLAGEIKVSEFKAVSYTRKYPEYNLDYYSFSPLGEMHLYSSSYFHSAPGLSDNAGQELDLLPANAFKQLFIDGGGPLSVMKQVPEAEEDYIDYLPMSAPYELLDRPATLLVKMGGGMGIFTALHHGARQVVAVEPNPDLINLLQDVPLVSEFNGNLLQKPGVKVVAGEPRAYCSSHPGDFDLVEISLIDSIGIAQTGGYPVNENFTYTTEGITDYMQALRNNGVLSVTVWNKLNPPRNVLRLLSTIVSSLDEQDIPDPAARVYCFQLLYQTATVLVKNSPFTREEIVKLNNFCSRMSFEVCYYPGMPRRDLDFSGIIAEYTALFQGRPAESARQQENREMAENQGNLLTLLDAFAEQEEEQELNPGDLYHIALQWMLDDRAGDFYKQYIFDIRPATDDRPYYTAYLKPRTMGIFIGQLNNISEEWGYLMLAGTFIQSLLFGALIIFIPIAGRWRELFRRRRGTAGVIIYYACLGLGYMLVEIYLIQRLVFFLEDPIISLSLVITAMLIISGLGSLLGPKLAADRVKRVRIAAVGICLALVFYIFCINPILEGLVGLPLLFKIPVAVLLIAISAFFLGIPFPNGLSALSEGRQGLLPWAWGMNGALSVTGSVLAKLVSVTYGYKLILVGAVILYLLAGMLFKANTAGTGKR